MSKNQKSLITILLLVIITCVTTLLLINHWLNQAVVEHKAQMSQQSYLNTADMDFGTWQCSEDNLYSCIQPAQDSFYAQPATNTLQTTSNPQNAYMKPIQPACGYGCLEKGTISL